MEQPLSKRKESHFTDSPIIERHEWAEAATHTDTHPLRHTHPTSLRYHRLQLKNKQWMFCTPIKNINIVESNREK